MATSSVFPVLGAIMLQSVSSGSHKPPVMGTLRGHLSTVSCVSPLYLPSNIDTRLSTTTLVSADSDGWLIWWDLSTRRPLGVWHGHTGRITSVIQLRGELYGKLLTHSKDGEVKLWDLFEYKNNVVKYRGPLSRRMPPSEGAAPPVFYQLPVNTLNFSNVDVCHTKLLTPATVDSNAFDLYDIPRNGEPLVRLHAQVEPLKLLESQGCLVPDTVRMPDSEKGRNFGIVMKVCFIEEKTFAVGYESGHVIKYRQEENRLRAESIDATHFPNPVMSLVYDPDQNVILSASSSDTISIQKLRQHRTLTDVTDTCTKFRTGHKGISHIAVRSDGLVGVVTWDGFTRCYTYDEGTLKFAFKFKKVTTTVNLNAINRSADDKAEQEEIGATQVRASCVEFARIQDVEGLKHDGEGGLKWNNGMSKMLVRPREQENLSRKWFFTGFSDGRITVQDLKSVYL